MKTIAVLLVAFFLGASFVIGTQNPPQTQKMVVKKIDQDIENTRKIVWKFGHDNSAVKKGYDTFVNDLRQAYINGEGMIDKDIHRILNALRFAAEKHQFQTRKDPYSTPYIVHPLGVAENLLSIGNVRNPDILMTGLLHDTVEDTDTSLDEINENFGPTIHDYVAEVTDDKALEKAERKRLQIEHAPNKSAGAAQVKLADKLYNLSDLATSPPSDWEKTRVDEYFVWAKNVVDNLPWVNAPLKNAVDAVIAAYQKK